MIKTLLTFTFLLASPLLLAMDAEMDAEVVFKNSITTDELITLFSSIGINDFKQLNDKQVYVKFASFVQFEALCKSNYKMFVNLVDEETIEKSFDRSGNNATIHLEGE